MDQMVRIKKELERKDTSKGRKVELLQILDSTPITVDVLKGTHIGKTVNMIRNESSDQELASLAKNIVKKWKKTFKTDRPITKSNSTSQTQNSQQQQQQQPQQQPHAQSDDNHSSANKQSNNSNSNVTPNKPSNANANQRTACASVPPVYSEYRMKSRNLLAEALKKPLPQNLIGNSEFLDEGMLAAQIEECIFQEFKGMLDAKYRTRVFSRISNLKDPKNPYLRLNVLRGDIAPERIAKMTADEMASDELKRQRELFTKEAINDHQMAVTQGTKTSEIKCPACKKYNVSYNQVQTRSADEPMTTFCHCNECGKRWKFC